MAETWKKIAFEDDVVLKGAFGAESFLYAPTAGAPEPKTAAEVRGILNVEDGADVTDAANVADAVNASTEVTAPAGSDTFPFVEYATGLLKKLTWTNLKATLKSYFDAIYEPVFAKNTAFNKNFGTAAGTVCQGNDSRLSNARTPTAHANTHATGQSDAIAPADIGAEPAFTKNSAFNKNFGTTAGTVCQGNDSRLSDARTPTAHAASHQDGGSDEIATATPTPNAIPKADASGKLNAWVDAPNSDIAAGIHAADEKTTPVDADEIGMVDTADSNVLKKLTWTNIKATLKAYFDTLYAALSHTHTATDVTDFDTEVSNNTDVAANTTHRESTSNPHNVTAAQASYDNSASGLTATNVQSAIDESLPRRWRYMMGV